jgi:hypothetical protein
MHSVEYKSSKAWAGKAGIVVGAATTGKPCFIANIFILMYCQDTMSQMIWL